MELIQRRNWLNVPSQNIFVEIPRHLLGIVLRMLFISNREDIIQLFKSKILEG